MRDPYGEPVGHGVAELNVDLFIESRGRIVDFSNARSSAKPNEKWVLPPGYAFVVEVPLDTIAHDYTVRWEQRRRARRQLAHGIISITMGVLLHVVFWPPSMVAAMCGGGCIGLGCVLLWQALAAWRRAR